MDRVVPFTVKAVQADLNPREFIVRDLFLRWVGSRVQGGSELQAGPGRGGANQVDDYFVPDQRSTSPVLGDMREHSMFDLVPVARAVRKMADRHTQPRLVSEVLQSHLPQAPTASSKSSTTGMRWETDC